MPLNTRRQEKLKYVSPELVMTSVYISIKDNMKCCSMDITVFSRNTKQQQDAAENVLEFFSRIPEWKKLMCPVLTFGVVQLL